MIRKVLITENVAQAGLDILDARGYQVDVRLGMTREELLAAIPAYDALIVRSATHVDRELIEAGEKLLIIGRAGVGVENIDIDAATDNGIIVCNAPTSNMVSAAELAFALLLACARKIAKADASMHRHEWRREDFIGSELFQKTLAICGLGRVGGLVAERAEAFGMELVGFDPFCSQERAKKLGVRLYDDMDKMLEQADFITIHFPLTPNTIGTFDAGRIARMKPGVIVVNTAPEEVFDSEALAEAVKSGHIGALGFDVWENKPLHDSPFHDLENVIITPHIGAATNEAQSRAGVQIAEYVTAGLEGFVVPTAINIAPSEDVLSTVSPYIPACTIVGSLLTQLHGHVPSQVRLTPAGSLANADMTMLKAGILDGMISYRSDKRVTGINVDDIARRHGVSFEQGYQPDAHEYASSLTIEAGGASITCTLFGVNQRPCIVELLGYRIEVVSRGRALIFEYVDGPGRVGTIGTILGDAGISITTMQVSKKEDSPNALVFMKVDRDVPGEVLEQLRQKVEPVNLWSVRL